LQFPEGGLTRVPSSVLLHYRHVDHAERWVSLAMERSIGNYTAAIPAEYTNSGFSLQYYFELRQSASSVAMYPGFNGDLSNQPYFVVMRSPA
ncbi:MAG TPA: hypothetical protein VH325_07455, partial [Bryobacteraceae bacterium]|nr:hypothetical protein [Bryobacteraceae bacterium]